MTKKLMVPLEKLKKLKSAKKKLVNFWIEEDLHEAFADLCEKELDQQSASEVLRKMIYEICVQNGYWKRS